MIEKLLLGIALIVLWQTAKPILLIKRYVVKLSNSELLEELLFCPQCSAFWLAFGIWFIPFPDWLSYAIYLCAIVTIVNILHYNYIDDTTFKE